MHAVIRLGPFKSPLGAHSKSTRRPPTSRRSRGLNHQAVESGRWEPLRRLLRIHAVSHDGLCGVVVPSCQEHGEPPGASFIGL